MGSFVFSPEWSKIVLDVEHSILCTRPEISNRILGPNPILFQIYAMTLLTTKLVIDIDNAEQCNKRVAYAVSLDDQGHVLMLQLHAREFPSLM